MTPPAPSLINGQNVPVKFVDGSIGLVVLKRLTIRQLYAFVDAAHRDQTPELVAVCADQNDEWVDRLSVESFAELAEKCILQNFPQAMIVAQRDPVIAAKIMPILAKLQKLALSVSELLPANGRATNALLPAPAPLASAAATGSVALISPPTASSSSSCSTPA